MSFKFNKTTSNSEETIIKNEPASDIENEINLDSLSLDEDIEDIYSDYSDNYSVDDETVNEISNDYIIEHDVAIDDEVESNEESVSEKKEGKIMNLKERLQKINEENDVVIKNIEEKAVEAATVNNAKSYTNNILAKQKEFITDYFIKQGFEVSVNEDEEAAKLTINW